MRIRVSHELKLTFPTGARALHLDLRLTPRSYEAQYVMRWRVGVDLDATLKVREDAFGSVVQSLSWHRPIESLTVTALGEVQTNDAVGMVRGAVDPLPHEMFLRGSPLAHPNPALRAFAEKAGQGASDPLDRLHRWMKALHAEVAAEPGFGGESPAAEAFALKKGCEADFAHIFVAMARATETPARFVTGYRLDEAETAGEMSAWAEAFAPGYGWIAFDPAHDICPNDSYVRVAVGLDARDAAPARYWTNAPESSLTASLRVEQASGQSQN